MAMGTISSVKKTRNVNVRLVKGKSGINHRFSLLPTNVNTKKMNLIFFFRRKTGAFHQLKNSPSKEEGYRLRETDNRLSRTKKQQSQASAHSEFTVSAPPSVSTHHNNSSTRSKQPSFEEMKLSGFRGTRYDYEIILSSGNFSLPTTAGASAIDVGSDPSAATAAAPAVVHGASSSSSGSLSTQLKSKRSRKEPSLEVRVASNEYTRSLRVTPSRMRARCERGRAASDSSSGISDDSSSNSSGSDRDSGIETSGEYEKEPSPAVVAAALRDAGVLESAVDRLSLDGGGGGGGSGGEPAVISNALGSPAKSKLNQSYGSSITQTARVPASPSVKLTIRVKRSTVLDEVLQSGCRTNLENNAAFSNAAGIGGSLDPGLVDGEDRPDATICRKKKTEYEVCRIEGGKADEDMDHGEERVVDSEVSFRYPGSTSARSSSRSPTSIEASSSPGGQQRKKKKQKRRAGASTEEVAAAASGGSSASGGGPFKKLRLKIGGEACSEIQYQSNAHDNWPSP